VWIKRLVSEVQQKALWDSSQTINRAPRCVSLESAIWENPARITRAAAIQVWLIFVNGLLSFKIPERIVADPPHPLMKP
jgi:hypothetical protein